MYVRRNEVLIVNPSHIFLAYQALRQIDLVAKDEDDDMRRLISLQGYAMLIYYPLEHMAWVGWT